MASATPLLYALTGVSMTLPRSRRHFTYKMCAAVTHFGNDTTTLHPDGTRIIHCISHHDIVNITPVFYISYNIGDKRYLSYTKYGLQDQSMLSFFLHNPRHRRDGPAMIVNGSAQGNHNMEFYLYGRYVPNPLLEAIRKMK